MVFLSGAWNPPGAMSRQIRWLSLVSRMCYFIDFGYGVILKGNGTLLVFSFWVVLFSVSYSGSSGEGPHDELLAQLELELDHLDILSSTLSW